MLKPGISERKTIYLTIIWLLTAILLLYAVFFTYANGFRKISFSLDEGDIYDADQRIIESGIIEGDRYRVTNYVDFSQDDINYLRVTVDEIDDNQAILKFNGYVMDDETKSWKLVYSTPDVVLHAGDNDIKIDSTDYILSEFIVEGVDRNVIQKVQFRQSIRSISPVGAALCMAGAFIAYLILTIAVLRIWRGKKHISCVSEGVKDTPYTNGKQASYLLINDNYRYISKSRSFAILTVSFCIMIMASLIMEMVEAEYILVFRRYFAVQICLCLIILIVSALTKTPRKPVSIDKAALGVWGAFVLYTLISDILVDKPFRFAQTAIFIVLVLLGYTWSSYRNSTISIKSFEVAVQLFLVILVILSLIRNHAFGTERYSGPIENPSIYALFLGTIWAVLLGSMECHIKRHDKPVTTIMTGAEMIVVLILLYASQSLTPLIAVAGVTALWIFRMVSSKLGIKRTLFIGFAFIIIAGLGITVLTGHIIKSGQASDSRLIGKLASLNLTTILSGRDYYWREHISEMNLFGHGEKAYLWGHKKLPHNAFIGMAYMYGVPCVVPYIIMMLMAVEKSYRFANRPVKYSAVPLYCIVSFIIMSMADNVEQPFVWLPWIAYYLMMAPVMVRSVEEIESLGGTQ